MIAWVNISPLEFGQLGQDVVDNNAHPTPVHLGKQYARDEWPLWTIAHARTQLMTLPRSRLGILPAPRQSRPNHNRGLDRFYTAACYAL